MPWQLGDREFEAKVLLAALAEDYRVFLGSLSDALERFHDFLMEPTAEMFEEVRDLIYLPPFGYSNLIFPITNTMSPDERIKHIY